MVIEVVVYVGADVPVLVVTIDPVMLPVEPPVVLVLEAVLVVVPVDVLVCAIVYENGIAAEPKVILIAKSNPVDVLILLISIELLIMIMIGNSSRLLFAIIAT